MIGKMGNSGGSDQSGLSYDDEYDDYYDDDEDEEDWDEEPPPNFPRPPPANEHPEGN